MLDTNCNTLPRYEGLWENDAKCGYGMFSYLKGNHRSVSGSWIDDVIQPLHAALVFARSLIFFFLLQVLSGWACVTCRNGDTIDGGQPQLAVVAAASARARFGFQFSV